MALTASSSSMKTLPLLRSLLGRRPFARRGVVLLAGLLAGLFLASPPAVRAQEAAVVSTLHTFDGLAISAYRDTLLSDGDGNFYGVNDTTVVVSGDQTPTDAGQVFKLAADGTVTTLHSFAYPTNDNSYSALVRGDDGSFYGTAFSGGPTGSFVYKITPDGVFTDLHDFTNGSDGYQPNAPLVLGRDGNFYGTDLGGVGVIFKISPTGNFTILHEFTGYDGFGPRAQLVQGRDGSFYGTTDGVLGSGGPAGGLGTVFKITPAGAFTDLYHFGTGDGNFPDNALVEGYDGNFYGTPTGGGGLGGTVFQVTPTGAFTTLHTFTGGLDGGSAAGLALGDDGNFYGPTQQGGLYGQNNGFARATGPGYGTIFQITPAGALTTLYNFTGGADGRNPAGPLIMDGNGGFYGTTGGDGAAIAGTLFDLKVISHPSFFAGQESIGNGLYYLQFPIGNYFGYYGFLSDPNYLYHADLGYEYVVDAADGKNGIYLYDFASSTFFYTGPVFPFPYLYDFTLNTVVYYYPDPNNAGHFTSNPRYFYNFATGQIITK